MKVKIIFLILFIILAFNGCKEDEEKPPSQTIISADLPEHFPPMDIPISNPLTKEKIELGRHLYYDKSLSDNGPQIGNACASCHQQSTSFSSTKTTAVIAHVNLAWNNSFLWNGAVEGSLEKAMVFELVEFFKADVNYLKSNPRYQELFTSAFPSDEISINNAAEAMASFLRMLHSTESKYDYFLMGETELSPSEQRGYEIFNSERGDCFHCHTSPLMTDLSFHNTGLETKFADHLGRFEVTGETIDVGSFKTPTLRNIALTAPYMHDDRFATLMDVINHYDHGVLKSPVLDPIMSKPGKETGLNLSESEKSDIVSFLMTLTDTSIIQNKGFSNPW